MTAAVFYGRYASPHYAMPLLPPLMCLLAPVLDRDRVRRIGGIVLTLAAIVGGQAVLAASEANKEHRLGKHQECNADIAQPIDQHDNPIPHHKARSVKIAA